jgi:Ca2+-binding RTX toxin-like protein
VDFVTDKVTEAANGGVDTVNTAVSYTLQAGSSVELLRTDTTAAVTLVGNERGQTIEGNAAGNGLYGKAGNDTLTGGGGNDLFLFDTTLNATTNVDTITDFNAAQDTIRLDNAVFTALTTAGTLAAGAFNTGAATQADDRIIYNTATGALIYDFNGSANGGGVKFATLIGAPALSAADFVIV